MQPRLCRRIYVDRPKPIILAYLPTLTLNLRRALNFFICTCALASDTSAPFFSLWTVPSLATTADATAVGCADFDCSDGGCDDGAAATGVNGWAAVVPEETAMSGRAAGAPQCLTIHLCCNTPC